MSGTRLEDYGACFYLTSRAKHQSIRSSSVVEEEIIVEELKPIEFQPLEELMNGLLDDSEYNSTCNDDDHFVPRENSEPEIYTSFLTIDVTKFSGSELKHRDTLRDLFSMSSDSLHSDTVDGEHFEQGKADLNMIMKYLNNMPLDSSHWPQNYDVLRDLVKVYLNAKNTGSTFLSSLLDHFVKLKWPHIFCRCLTRISESFPQVFLHSFDRKINFEDPTPETLDMRYHTLEYAVAVVYHIFLLITLEITETHVPSIDACCEGGLIRFIFKDMFPKMHGITWGKHTAREEFLSAAMDIIYNCAKSCVSAQHYIENGAIEYLIQFRKETEYINANRINISALLALSYLIEDRTNHLIITDPAPLSVLFLCLNECFAADDHCYGDFTAAELLDGITRIVSHDVNKIMFCEQGNLGDLSKVFEEINNDDEYIAACRLLWTVSLLPKCRQVVKKRAAGILKILRKLKESTRGKVQNFVKMVLWEILDKFETPSQVPSLAPDLVGEYIYVSWESSDEAVGLDISRQLLKKGYKVLDEAQFQGSNDSPPMAEAVKHSAVVIVCVSRKYKHNPECFAAADYAFQTRRPIIPVIMERSYRPDGWLGLLIASKPWIDFSRATKFNGAMNLLVRQLGEKGKGVVSINGLFIGKYNELPAENGYYDQEQQILQDVATWNNRQVVDWLSGGRLINAVKEEKLKKIRGVHLIRLNQLRKESPDFYYSALEPQLGFTDVLDMLEFTEALERLTEGHL